MPGRKPNDSCRLTVNSRQTYRRVVQNDLTVSYSLTIQSYVIYYFTFTGLPLKSVASESSFKESYFYCEYTFLSHSELGQ